MEPGAVVQRGGRSLWVLLKSGTLQLKMELQPYASIHALWRPMDLWRPYEPSGFSVVSHERIYNEHFGTLILYSVL